MKVPIDQIIVDPTIQIRQHLHEEAVVRYMDAFDELPPIVVFDTPDGLLLSDGMHRMAAATRLGRSEIAADVRKGTRADAEEHAITANTKNAMPLTAGERDEGIRRLLARKWGFFKIAKAMSLPQLTVERIADGQKVKDDLSVTLRSRSHYEELARFPEEIREPLALAAVEQGWNSVELRHVAKEIADPAVSEERKRAVLASLAQPGDNGEATLGAEFVRAYLRESKGFTALPQISAFIGAAHSLLDHLQRDANPLARMNVTDLRRLDAGIEAAELAIAKLRSLVDAKKVRS